MTWENVGENTLKKENDLMNAYKTAFEGLAEIIRMRQDDDLIQIVDELEGDLKKLEKAGEEEAELNEARQRRRNFADMAEQANIRQ